VFERFTPPARQVLVYASDEARSLGHDYIGGEHILLGLLREGDGIAARVLVSLGITHQSARTHLVCSIGSRESPTTGQIPFASSAVESLERATAEADSMSHGFIGTEHVLLGLAGVGDETVHAVLAELGSSAEQIRAKVLALLSGSA
jgi:ATP-dependent Clp protease ATP-binding subunit ClpC